MSVKKKVIKKSSPTKKRTVRRFVAPSSDHVPQLAAVIVEERVEREDRREPRHVIIMSRAATALQKVYMVSCGSVLALALLLAGVSSFAATIQPLKNKTQGPLNEIGAHLGTVNDAPTVIANIIKIFIGLLGLIFVVLIIYGGFLWMTDNGDEKQVANAKHVIKNSVIGLIITVLSFAISNYIIGLLATSV